MSKSMAKTNTTTDMNNIAYTDNPAAADRQDRYESVNVNTGKVLQSWRQSLYAYEWMLPDGRIRTLDELPVHERDKRLQVETRLQNGEALEKPILGIGLLENIEIGSGRAVFLTLAAAGVETIPVHIPKSHAEDFAAFLA